ncbi:MAG: hypothetical protein NWR76_09905 [Opitutales bacterium]|nr:hypothetical protein [Opitutales bacterium]
MKSHQKIDKAARDLSEEVHEANFVGAKMKSERRYATLGRDYPAPDKLRETAGNIKQHTLEHLDQYLEQAEASFKRNGAQVHFAVDDDVCLIGLRVL